MRILSVFTIFFVLLIGALPTLAAEGGTNEFSGAVRIGYVDLGRALNDVSDGRRVKKRLKDEFREKQQQLDRHQKELAALKNNIDRNRLLISSDELKVREDQYRSKFFELQQVLAAFRREMETRESTITLQILKRLRKIVEETGKKEGYSLILEKSQDIVLYAPEGDDLTDGVIKAYDRSSGKKGRR